MEAPPGAVAARRIRSLARVVARAVAGGQVLRIAQIRPVVFVEYLVQTPGDLRLDG